MFFNKHLMFRTSSLKSSQKTGARANLTIVWAGKTILFLRNVIKRIGCYP